MLNGIVSLGMPSLFRMPNRVMFGHVAGLVLLLNFGLGIPLIGALYGVVKPFRSLLGVSANLLLGFANGLANFGAGAILSECTAKNGKHGNDDNQKFDFNFIFPSSLLIRFRMQLFSTYGQ